MEHTKEQTIKFATIDEALQDIKEGKMVVVMDDEDRENEGDLILAADTCTPEQIALLIRYTSGILCAPMTPARAQTLDLSPMVVANQDAKQTAFTVTCDAIDSGTGVSAENRAQTFRVLADPKCNASSISRPGHVFPLIARPGGVMVRRGHTEATTDLLMLAGKYPVGIIGELTNDDGTMMRLPHCAAIAEKFNLKLITIEALVQYRGKHGLTEPLSYPTSSTITTTTTKEKSNDLDVQPSVKRQRTQHLSEDDINNDDQGKDKVKEVVVASNNRLSSSSTSFAVSEKISKGLNLMSVPLRPENEHFKIGIIRTCWNGTLVGQLVQSFTNELIAHGVLPENIIEYQVPGSYEVPLAAQKLARTTAVHAVACFGLLLRGETNHFDMVATAVSQGVMNAQLATGVPIIYGVLACDTMQQAIDRCDPSCSLGKSLALTTLHSAALHTTSFKGWTMSQLKAPAPSFLHPRTSVDVQQPCTL